MNKRQLSELIRRELGIPWWADILGIGTEIHVADKEYLPCSVYEVRGWLSVFDTHPEQYEPEKNDCENFVYRMLGYLNQTIRGALGFAWSASHAFVIFHDGEQLWVVDAITKDINPYEQAKVLPQYNLQRHGLIVI